VRALAGSDVDGSALEPSMHEARPALHLTAPHGWLNDPLGITYRDGHYELFYQSLPGESHWNPRCQWGHATSPDLVTWTHHGSVLVPGDDEDGCWSGTLVPDPVTGEPTIFYTSVRGPAFDIGEIRTARAVDAEWQRWERAGTVVRAPQGEGIRVFRDPVVRREADHWRMFVGAGLSDGTAAAVSYTSADLSGWTYDGVLASSRTSPTGGLASGEAWECPQLVDLGERCVMIVSAWQPNVNLNVLAAVGTYAEGRLDVERWQQLTYGPGHYAPAAFTDAEGRPALMFWIRGVADPGGRWTGALSIPYRMSLVDGRVHLEPHPSVSEPLRSARPGVRHWRIATDELEAEARLDETVSVTVGPASVRVSAPGHDVDVPDPAGPVDVLVDGPVLEVCTGNAVVGLPFPLQ